MNEMPGSPSILIKKSIGWML